MARSSVFYNTAELVGVFTTVQNVYTYLFLQQIRTQYLSVLPQYPPIHIFRISPVSSRTSQYIPFHPPYLPVHPQYPHRSSLSPYFLVLYCIFQYFQNFLSFTASYNPRKRNILCLCAKTILPTPQQQVNLGLDKSSFKVYISCGCFHSILWSLYSGSEW